MTLRLSRNRKIIAISLATVLVLIFVLNHASYSGISRVPPSTLYTYGHNASQPSWTTVFMNYSRQPLGDSGPYYYFPLQVPGHSNTVLGLIPEGSAIMAGNTSTPVGHFYEAFFGIVLLKGPSSFLSDTALKINSVNIHDKNSSYGTQVEALRTLHTGLHYPFNYVLHSQAILVSSILVNGNGSYTSTLNPGTYFINANISLYYVHALYRSHAADMNIVIPWLDVISNYSGLSLVYYGTAP